MAEKDIISRSDYQHPSPGMAMEFPHSTMQPSPVFHPHSFPDIQYLQTIRSNEKLVSVEVSFSATDRSEYKSGAPRPRSLPHRRPFIWAAVWASLQYLGMVSLLTSMALFLLHPGMLATRSILISLAVTAVAWLIALFRRRAAFCPLCRGTPLINSGARAHAKAVRFPLLNHGTSATLSIIASHRFCCMYCGTRYDLFKPRPRHQRAESREISPASSGHGAPP